MPNNAPALFPITPLALIRNGLPYGTRTQVTFSATDAAGNTGTAISAVSIYDGGTPQLRTGACPNPSIFVAVGTISPATVSINHPDIQAYITCIKNSFIDFAGVNIVAVPAASVTLFGGVTDQAVGKLDYQIGALPPPPATLPVNTTITNRLRFKAVDASKNVGTHSLNFIGTR